MKNPVRYKCPECGEELLQIDNTVTCRTDSFHLEQFDGIYDFLTQEEWEYHEEFLSTYQTIRKREGRGSDDPEYYLRLPENDERSKEWALRGGSKNWLMDFLKRTYGNRTCTILDAGAGNCWLTRYVAEAGHNVVALDLNIDKYDGLAAGRHYLEQLPIVFHRIRASFDSLPFMSDSFDVCIFNASFHYSEDPFSVMNEMARIVRSNGHIIIIDSPFYHKEESGLKMMNERAIRGRSSFVTYKGMEHIAKQSGMILDFHHQHYPPLQRLKRMITEFRLGREIASMPRVVLTPP